MPEAGADPVSVTFPTTVAPPVTVAGFKPSDVNAGGWIVTFAVFVTPEKVAEILLIVVALTAVEETEKLADITPEGIITVGGTEAAVLALERLTFAPAVGAGPLRLTVPVRD